MTDALIIFVCASLVLVLTTFVTPRHLAAPLASMVGAVLLAILSPWGLIWLCALIGLVSSSAALGDRIGQKDLATVIVVASASASLLWLREIDTITLIGGAYFTLRNLHVMFDWWMGRYRMPSVTALLQYNLFPPTMVAGPIHRYPNFERQWQRRRTSASDMAAGAERALLGLATAVILGMWMVNEAAAPLHEAWTTNPGFLLQWTLSAFDWIELYLVFSGLSSVAIGLSLMIGLRIEENFNRPFSSANLVEFWSRWHMTLSLWCRDYVYQPIATATRSPLTGVLAAMLVLGLWHETSAYYVLWAIWQAIGIVGSRALAPLYPALPKRLERVATPLLMLGWLSLSKPVALGVLNVWG